MFEWTEEALKSHHDTSTFESGNDEINLYLRRFAFRNHRRNISKTFVACPRTDPQVVVGYYTLVPAELSLDDLPGRMRPGLPRYPVGAYRLARLGVTRALQGQGLGRDLVTAAGLRALEIADQIGGVLMIVDAMSEDLADWYQRTFKMEPLDDRPLTLVVNLRTFQQADDA